MTTFSFPADAKKVSDSFQKFFGTFKSEWVDNLLSAITKHFVLDIIKFDEWLYEKHGNYDEGENAISMKELILREYGADAEQFMQSLLEV